MATKLSVTTTVAILAILYLVVVDASTITTTTTTQKPCKSDESCDELINSLDFTYCEQVLLWVEGGARSVRNPWLNCCSELGKIDGSRRECRCDALQMIINKGKEIDGLDLQTVEARAWSTLAYCRMPAACNWEAAALSS